MFLVQKGTYDKIPLTSVHFDVDIEQSYANFTMHQTYVNNEENKALETVFLMPVSESLAVHKIEIEFVLKDGTRKFFETKVEERQVAIQKYDDAVATGKTVVMSTLSEKLRNIKQMLRVNLGNFPPMSTAYLKVICS